MCTLFFYNKTIFVIILLKKGKKTVKTDLNTKKV